MFFGKKNAISVVWNTRLLLVIITCFAAANRVYGASNEDWMNVGSCGKGLNCGPSCQLLCLKMHNYYRSLHGSPPLKCNHKLAVSAQKWTDQQAKNRKMYHSKWTDQYTESISWKSWGWFGMEKMAAAIPGAVRSWYKEIKSYNYRTGKGGGRVVGHFRAVVWKSETELGCGFRAVPGKGTFITAHYAPASHASYRYFSLVPSNVPRRRRKEPLCHIRSSQRQLCGRDLGAPFVTPAECTKRGCCYDDIFLSEPKVRPYSKQGRIWCFIPKGGRNPSLFN